MIEKIATSEGDKQWQGNALMLLAAVNRVEGHASYGADVAIRAKVLLRESGEITGLSRASYELGYCLLLQGNLREAREELEAAAALAKISSDALTEALAARRLAFCYVQQSDYVAARRAYERALRAFEALGSEWRTAQAIYGLIVLEICLGDLEQARQYVEAWDAFYESTDVPLRRNRWRLLKGWLAVVEGDSQRARKLLEAARKELEELGAQRDVALCWEYVGDAFGLEGQDSAAVVAYEESVSWGRRVAVASDVVVESTRKMGEALSRQHRIPEALAWARRAGALTRTYDEPLEKAALLRLRGVLKIQRGRLSVGLDMLEASWGIFTKIGADLEARVTARILEYHCAEYGLETEASNWLRRRGSKQTEVARLLLPRSREPRAAVRGLDKRWLEAKRDANAHGIVSQDTRILRAFETTLRAAPLDLPILVLGETGTGKELFATLAHDRSGRKGSVLAVNCAALPPDILDAELFGHAKGAYTGAYHDRPGLVEAANGGTLFLDEIGEMSLAVQGRLLRAIEAKEIRRIGENHVRKVSTRFVGATHRNLEDMVRDGKFRADLYFRLRGVIVTLPPLRERPGDILLLADHFLSQAAERLGRSLELTADARERLQSHPWPGNVRELRSVIERAAAMCELGEPIRSEDLGVEQIRIAGSLEEHLEDEERRRLLATLESVDWNRSKAARVLRLKRTTLLGKLKRLGIELPTK